MTGIFDYPVLVFALSFGGMVLFAWIGARMATRRRIEPGAREDLGVIQAATLTLLGLIIGFTFSMALTRYDQRKNYEEAEANAIGTEYVRAGLLPVQEAAKVRALLASYLEQRILFYTIREDEGLRNVDARTARLQSELWSAVQAPALAQPTPILALVVSGMNDVLNSQGYTQAAWWNRIPLGAWCLLGAIALCANLLVGLGVRNPAGESKLLLVLPLVAAVAFFLIADIDSPRAGIIHVQPQNLNALAQSLRNQ